MVFFLQFNSFIQIPDCLSYILKPILALVTVDIFECIADTKTLYRFRTLGFQHNVNTLKSTGFVMGRVIYIVTHPYSSVP